MDDCTSKNTIYPQVLAKHMITSALKTKIKKACVSSCQHVFVKYELQSNLTRFSTIFRHSHTGISAIFARR